MYGNLVVGFETSYTTCGWYHGGINIRGSGAGHPKDPTGGLKGGFFGGSPLRELPRGESPRSKGTKGGMTLYHIRYVEVGSILVLPGTIGVIGCDQVVW
jgi:hypothetical protein